MSLGISGGKRVIKRFLILRKQDDDFILAKATVQVSKRSTSVLLVVRTSIYGRYTASTKKKTIRSISKK